MSNLSFYTLVTATIFFLSMPLPLSQGWAADITAIEVEKLLQDASRLARDLKYPNNKLQNLYPYKSSMIINNIHLAAKQTDIPPSLIAAVIKCESNWNPQAISKKGARGLMQVLPRTAWGEFGIHPDALWDPHTNILAGSSYLRLMAERFAGDPKKIIAAYNAGPTRLSSNQRLPKETTLFLRCVRQWHQHYAKSFH